MKKYWTRELLIDAMQDFALKLGRTPARKDLERHRPCTATFRAEFGNVKAAQEAAGLEPTRTYEPKSKWTPPPKIKLVCAPFPKFEGVTTVTLGAPHNVVPAYQAHAFDMTPRWDLCREIGRYYNRHLSSGRENQYERREYA